MIDISDILNIINPGIITFDPDVPTDPPIIPDIMPKMAVII